MTDGYPNPDEVTWADPAPGDWDYDPNEDPKWMDPATPRRRIETDEQYKLVADHIVKEKPLKIAGKDEVVNDKGVVVGVVIDNLRRLVDAVQAHRDARNADSARTTGFSPTCFCIANCIVCECNLASRFVGVVFMIKAHFTSEAIFNSATFQCPVVFSASRFANEAYFDSCRFEDTASFRNAAFDSNAWFGSSTFERKATFDSARFTGTAEFSGSTFELRGDFNSTNFKGTAGFCDVTFVKFAGFKSCVFGDTTNFDSASFGSTAWFEHAKFFESTSFSSATFLSSALFKSAYFESMVSFYRTRFMSQASFLGIRCKNLASFKLTSFAGEAWFAEASAHRLMSFQYATIEHRLVIGGMGITDTAFDRHARLVLDNINIRPSGSIEISPEQLTLGRDPDRLMRYWIRRDRSPARRKHLWRDWLLQYHYIVIVLPLEDFINAVDSFLGSRHKLGLGILSPHRLILGEDARQTTKGLTDPNRHPSRLEKATATYNTLRDVFRNQPSTDLQEDICIIRHQDLVRKTWDDGTRLAKLKIFFHWLVMRNMLGYLIVPTRIAMTAAVILFGFALIYQLFIGPTDIGHGHFEPAQTGGTYVHTEAYKYWKDDALNPIYLSLMTFVTLGYGDFQPAAGWLKLATGIEGILGVTLLALFTVAWGRKMIR